MPSLSSITLPLNELHSLDSMTFTPIKLVGNQAFFADMMQSKPALRSTLAVSLTQPVKNQKLYKARLKMMIVKEKMDLTDPVNPVGMGVVDYINSSDTVYLFDGKSDEEDRQEVILRTVALNDIDVQEDIALVLRSLAPIY